MKISEKIASRRKELGLTLENVGDAVGVGKSTVRKWETGDIKTIRCDKIRLLASVLDMNPVELIGEDDTEPRIHLTDDESKIVTAYRMADQNMKSIMMSAANAVLAIDISKKKRA